MEENRKAIAIEYASIFEKQFLAAQREFWRTEAELAHAQYWNEQAVKDLAEAARQLKEQAPVSVESL